MESIVRALVSMLARSLPLVAVLFPLMWFIGSRPKNRLTPIDLWIVFLVSWVCVALAAPMDFGSGYWTFIGAAALIPIAATFLMNSARSGREPVRLSIAWILSPWIVLALLLGLALLMSR